MLDQARLRRAVDKAIVKKSFMTLATSSEADRSHAAGVMYAAVDGFLYVSTNMNSRKALGRDDPALRSLLDSGRLKRLTSHGELDDPDNWFIKITPTGKVHTFGLGVPLLTLIRHPLETMGSVELS